MIRVFILVAVIGLLTFLAVRENAPYFKKLYKEILAPTVWKRVEIVEEKHTFEDFGKDFPWEMLELLVLGSVACVVSFVMGWNLNYYRSVYGKSEQEEFEIKQSHMEEKIEHLEEKFDNFEKRYSCMTMEMFYTREVEEKELLVTKDFCQQIEAEGIDQSSQTSKPGTRDACCQEDPVNSTLNSTPANDSPRSEYSSVTCGTGDLFPDKIIPDEKPKIDSWYEASQLEEQNLKSDKENQILVPVICCDPNKNENLTEETEVTHCFPTLEVNTCYNVYEFKQNVEEVEPTENENVIAGSGECEETLSYKVNQYRRIPHYQGLRKGSDQRSKGYKENDNNEMFQNKNAEIPSDVNKPRRVGTPRQYSSPETLEVAPGGGSRRRKQRNYNVK